MLLVWLFVLVYLFMDRIYKNAAPQGLHCFRCYSAIDMSLLRSSDYSGSYLKTATEH